MVKFREAAHAAFRAVEDAHLGAACVCPANALVYEFLLEARKIQLEQSSYDGGMDHQANTYKKAAEHVKDHHNRIYDAASAQEVKYVGAKIARVIVNELFALYPPEPPSEEELEERRMQKAAMKQQQPAKRNAAQNVEDENAGDGAEVAGAGGRKRTKAAAQKLPKRYVPKIGTANYAFLIVLLEAQKGPARKEYLTKNELMEQAEASGLSDKSIYGEGNINRAQTDKSQYYTGWSCLISQLVNQHNLVCTWSNPKKCALTTTGLALAEELYRYAVASGKMGPIPGIPFTGPMLFQLQEAPAAPEEAGPGRWEVQQAAAAPAAAPRAAPRAAPAGRQGARGAAAAVLSPTESVPRPPVAAATTAVAPLSRPWTGAVPAHGGGYGTAGMAGVPARAGPQTGAAAIAAALAAAAGTAAHDWVVQGGLSLAAPMGLSPAACRGLPAMGTAAGTAGAARLNNRGVAGIGALGNRGWEHGVHSQGVREMRQDRDSDVEVISLLDDDDPLPLAARLASALAAAGRAGLGGTAMGLAAASGAAGRAHSGAAAARPPAHADVACMVEMGFSDKKARKALRRASDVYEAVDIMGELSSDSDSEGSPDSPSGFHDAREALPEDEDDAKSDSAISPPPLGANPAMVAYRRLPAAVEEPQPYRHGTLQQQQEEAGWDAPVHYPAVMGAPQPMRAEPQQPYQLAEPRLGGFQQAPAGRPMGHIRLGSQQGPGRMLLGSQQSGGLGDWGTSQSQDELGADELLEACGLGPAAIGGGAGTSAGAAAGRVPRPAAPPVPRLGGVGAALPGPSEGDMASGGPGPSIRQRRELMRLPPIGTGKCFKDEYEVVFLVDGREQYSQTNHQGKVINLQDHLNQLLRTGMRVEQRQLKIGDAIWVARSRANPSREYVLDFIVERKSVEDLNSSIRDKRYDKQKFWLSKCGLRHVNYLIEGDVDTLLPLDQKRLKTAAASTQVLNKFRLLRTKSHHDTLRLYHTLTKSIERMYSPLGSPASAPPSQLMTFAQWDEHMASIVKGNTTLHDVWALMLTAVPGLGPDAVQVIIQHYPTPMALYKRYHHVISEALARRQDGVAAACSLLAGLKREGGRRGLGPDKSAKVYQVLFANGWNLAS